MTRESDESDDQWPEPTRGVTTDDVRLGDAGASGGRPGGDGIEDVFERGDVAPAVVEASVDALFERFEEDSPEEVMLADRFPDESAVVPTPAAFDEFAEDVVDDVDPAAGEFDGSLAAVNGDGDVPASEDVVGFEDAPVPSEGVDDGSGSDATPGRESTSSPETSAGAGADSEAAAFEWVSEPVVTETVLADPDAARTFAGRESGDEEESAGVLSELRSSFPF